MKFSIRRASRTNLPRTSRRQNEECPLSRARRVADGCGLRALCIVGVACGAEQARAGAGERGDGPQVPPRRACGAADSFPRRTGRPPEGERTKGWLWMFHDSTGRTIRATTNDACLQPIG